MDFMINYGLFYKNFQHILPFILDDDWSKYSCILQANKSKNQSIIKASISYRDQENNPCHIELKIDQFDNDPKFKECYIEMHGNDNMICTPMVCKRENINRFEIKISEWEN